VRGLPLGVSDDSTWQVGQDRLAPGDTLVIFSDGLLDLHPSFEEALAAVLTAVREEPGAQEVPRRLTACACSARQPDDVTVVAARRRAG
jgi:phosphoserine phosphatase RsbU/P